MSTAPHPLTALRTFTGNTLADWRGVYHIYRDRKTLPWTREEARDMLRNWIAYAIDLAQEEQR